MKLLFMSPHQFFIKENNTLLLYPSTRRVYTGVILIILLVIAYLFFLKNTDPEKVLYLYVILPGLLLMGLLLLIRKNRPYLVLTQKNLIKKSVYGLWPKRVIPWNAIIEIQAMGLSWDQESIVRIWYKSEYGKNRYAVIWAAHLPLENTELADFLNAHRKTMLKTENNHA